MQNYLRKKVGIFRFEAKRSGKSIISFFLAKTIRWIDKQFTLLLDTLAVVLISPLALFCRFKKSPVEKKAYFFGLEHVVDKIVLRGDYFKEQGYDVKYFSFDFSGLRSPSLSDGDVIKFRKYIFLDLPQLVKMFFIAPTFLEFYYEGNGVRQYLAHLFVNTRKTVISSIDRGVFLFDKHTNVNPFFYSLLRRRGYLHSHLLLVRDPDMYEHLKGKMGDTRSAIILDYNRTKVMPFDLKEFSDRNSKKPINILFLNGFSLERSPELFVQAMPLVLEKNKNVHFTIVGARNELERGRVMNIAKELNVEGYLSLYNWDPDSQKYYKNACIYVLPAKFIFCNIALLEAMERGLVPIVSNVDKADLIIKDGINGFVFDDTKEQLAEKIVTLVNNFQLRIDLGSNARSTIIFKFDIGNRMEVIEKVIRKLQNSSQTSVLSEQSIIN